MLQQTQVARVIPKYKLFLKRFPTIRALSRASLRDVLRAWQGLGYNRRALALKKAAETVVKDYYGEIPSCLEALDKLPGVGEGTAGAIMAFAFNKPVVFIETNIRRVFIHFFFKNRRKVSDKEILPLIEKTLDHKHPREWYWALMDHGASHAKGAANPNRRSAGYTTQKPFRGSKRGLRGRILAAVIVYHALSRSELVRKIAIDPKLRRSLGRHGFGTIVGELVRDGFLRARGERISIATR
jgi:A/G-specific adenine glycosylase